MWSGRLAALLILCFSVCANAQSRAVVVYPGHAENLSGVASNALDAELKRLLSPAGIELEFGGADKHSRKTQVASESIVALFEGNCSADSLPLMRGVSNSSKVLGQAAVLNDGISPYFRVNCDRIARILTPGIRPLSVAFRDRIFGRALARVAAHELYHILAQTTEHGDSGVAKAQLSFENLVADRFDLSPDSIARIRTPHTATVSSNPYASLCLQSPCDSGSESEAIENRRD
jgi:hypothetical protein